MMIVVIVEKIRDVDVDGTEYDEQYSYDDLPALMLMIIEKGWYSADENL